MPLAIETISLTKKFKQTTACDRINLQVKKGEMFALTGRNGAGKTTLIKILCMLLLPDSGQAYVNGFDVSINPMAVKNSIGLVNTEERSFYWRLTGRENLIFFGALGNLSKGEVNKRIEELSPFLGLDGYMDKLVQDYSSGMRQKLSLIRGLLNNPEVLFMDEPTHSLDPCGSQSLMRFIKENFVKGNKKTVFFCTHQLEEAEEFADRISIIHKGKIQFCKTTSELKQEGGNLSGIFNHYTA